MAPSRKIVMKPSLQFFLILSAVCLFLSAGLKIQPAAASPAAAWAPDEKVPGYLDDTYPPALIADHNRTVHAFTSQWVYTEGRKLAIVYRQWTLNGGWTRPVDILLSPIGGDANFVGAFLDASDTFHLIFTATERISRRTFVFYSHAPASLADLASAWSPPVVVADGALGLNSGAIAGDEQGNLVIIYSGNRDGSGVYYVRSKNSGKEWTEPAPLFLTLNADLSAFSLRLIPGGDGQTLRAAWNVVTNLGVDQALYFATFNTQSGVWSSPLLLDERIDLPEYFGPSFPSITDNGREIVIFYNGGNPVPGRPVAAGRPIQRARVSFDGGVNWSEPLDPFPFHVGRSGEHAMVLDGSGVPHVLFVQRIESLDERGNYSIVGGIWHSVFQNNAWSNPDRFVTTLSPHDVHAVVAQGNVLLVVWRQDPGEGVNGIWYSYNMLALPELPVTPLAPATLQVSIHDTPTPSPQVQPFTPTPLPPFLEQAPPSDLGRNPALPILVGMAPVMLILIGVIVGYRFLTSRR
jgi:hypothetical protein